MKKEVAAQDLRKEAKAAKADVKKQKAISKDDSDKEVEKKPSNPRPKKKVKVSGEKGINPLACKKKKAPPKSAPPKPQLVVSEADKVGDDGKKKRVRVRKRKRASDGGNDKEE